MLPPEAASARVTARQQARLAYVYVRQSSPGQVRRHGESTELQYRLVERAVALGWPRERVLVLDDDLGKSGRSAADRAGFQHLIAEVGLGHVGLVLSLDASRLARNNADWHRLLELCAPVGTLLADGERVYDPGSYHDRLLLGLSGMMSEAELHHLRLRLRAGLWHKAARGALHLALPVGLVRLPDGTVALDPDEEVRARLALVFAKFAELGAAKAVTRYLRRAGLPLPARPRRGPAPYPLRWEPATSGRILELLKNPAYAGAYVYGRQQTDPARRVLGRRHSGVVRRPPDEWPVCLRDAYPAFLSWEQFLANQQRLHDNQYRLRDDRRGAPREGRGLLQGIARCGRCGARMRLRYAGPRGEYASYECAYAQQHHGGPRCQDLPAAGVDVAVEQQLLAALVPDQLALALAALAQLEQEEAALARQWELRLERARYEAQRAERQYLAVEPEHRLVARTLEQQWEERLRAADGLEREYAAWQRQRPVAVGAAEQEAILALASDLPALWHAPTTTAAERKRLLRLVIAEVVLDQHRRPGAIWCQINWQTGAHTEHWVARPVTTYAQLPERAALEARVRALHAAGHPDAAIAATLNAEGFRPPRRTAFRALTVWALRKTWGLPRAQPAPPPPPSADDRRYSVDEAAVVLGVAAGTVFTWVRRGRLRGAQVAKGQPWTIALTPDEIAALRARAARDRPRVRQLSMEVV